MSDFRWWLPLRRWQDRAVLVGTEQAYRAVAARDTRFDGCFVHAVRSTGIYCRPSCPARTPHRDNSAFFPTSAAAHAAGYRACRRCLPDAVPGSPEWDMRSDLAGRAMRLINDGVLDRVGVRGLAAELGYSPRHLTRVLTAELGAGPLGLARAHRAHAARLLIETTELAFTDIAFAAGFASLRQFNTTVREVFAAAPTDLRRRARHAQRPAGTGRIRLRLPFRDPCDLSGMLAFLRGQAVPGLERSTADGYARTLRLPHGAGVAELRPEAAHLACTLRLTDLRDLGSAVNRIRRLFDLDADAAAIAEVLGDDPALAPLAHRRPGVRVPGSVDGAETLLRAVLHSCGADSGAQRLVAALGEPLALDDRLGGEAPLLFPEPGVVADRGAEALDGQAPAVRTPVVEALRAAASALATDDLRVHPGCSAEELRARLRELLGLTSQTADAVAVRVLGLPDVLVSDRTLLRGAKLAGLPTDPVALAEHARRWRPWRSYAGALLRQLARISAERTPTCTGPQ
ncbi:bifunctional transcriptional activator/DNA repair enzyme AdaA [Bounagaea algeriensis]